MQKEELESLAKTIIYQLTLGHPNALKVMLGTKNVTCFEIEYKGYKQPAVAFDFKMSKKYKYCRIIYQEGIDVYAMQFLDRNAKVVTEYEEVYCDELYFHFTHTTGLELVMPRIVGF